MTALTFYVCLWIVGVYFLSFWLLIRSGKKYKEVFSFLGTVALITNVILALVLILTWVFLGQPL
jgi:amino acid transporter